MAITTINHPKLITEIILGKPRLQFPTCYWYVHHKVRKHFLPVGTFRPAFKVPHLLNKSWFNQIDSLDKLSKYDDVWWALFDLGFRPYSIIDRSLVYDAGDWSFSWRTIQGLKRNLRN